MRKEASRGKRDGLLSVSQTAHELGICEQRVRALCCKGRMGRKIGHTWVITPEEIEANRDRKPGWKPGKSRKQSQGRREQDDV